MRRRTIILTIALGALVALACLLRLLIDRDPNSGVVALRWPDDSYSAFRATAMVIGIIVGASLATSGVLLQALLRNPLASPFILGISSGAGLGVMAGLYWREELKLPMIGGNEFPAVIGACAALAIVFALGRRRGWLDPLTLVLVGVVISTICAAGIMFFQHLVDKGLLTNFTRWLMGTIPDAADSSSLWTAAVVAACGLLIAFACGRAMDAATFGDDEARSIGLSIGPLRIVLFLLAGTMTATTVALAGPIGFIGLIAPHLGRLLVGPRHRELVIAAAMIGAILILGADVARQAIELGGGRMPIGIFTAIIGGPIFIWLLRTGRGDA